MKDYTQSIYRLELETGSYAFDISFPEIFVEKEVSRQSYHHTHAKYEVVFVRGDGEREQNRFLINPPRCKHATWFENQNEPHYLTSFRFSAKKRQTASGSSVLDEFVALRSPVVVPDTFRGAVYIQAVRRELREQGTGYLEVMQAELTLLMLEIARHLPVEHVTEQTAPANLDELKLDLIDQFFEMNYSRPECRREELAQMLCISERQLSRIFAQNYAMSFREKLLQTRMERAATIRKSGSISAEKMSELVGYSSASAFRAAYKNYFGQSFREK